MLIVLLLSIWPYYVVPVVGETVASEVALSKPWNREINPISGEVRPVQYVFRAAGAALFADVDNQLTNRNKKKLVWLWRGLYIVGNAYLIQRSVRRWKEP